MLTDTQGIVIRQIKTSYNRRMVILFTDKYGKISAGTSLGDRGKSKSSLALRPFTHGRYELFVNRDSYHINSAEVLKTFFRIGEDLDKYMHAAYVLEFTDRVLEEGVPQQGIFQLLLDFYQLLESRKKGIGTLVLAYQIKLLYLAGVGPLTDRCAVCGKKRSRCSEKQYFSVAEGGLVCDSCARGLTALEQKKTGANSLICNDEFDIINVLKYFSANPLKKLENIALNEVTGKALEKVIREYSAYYLDTKNIKSETLI